MPAAPFHAELLRPMQGVGVVAVTGEVDLHTARELDRVLDTAVVEKPRRLIVDLTGVGFIDSIGLSVLARSARQLLDAGGAYEIVCSDRKLREIFEITGLDRVLTFHATRADALGR